MSRRGILRDAQNDINHTEPQAPASGGMEPNYPIADGVESLGPGSGISVAQETRWQVSFDLVQDKPPGSAPRDAVR